MESLHLTLHEDLVGSVVLENGKLALYSIPKGAQMTMHIESEYSEPITYGDISTFYMVAPATVNYNVTVNIPNNPKFVMRLEETKESYLKKLLGDQENKK